MNLAGAFKSDNRLEKPETCIRIAWLAVLRTGVPRAQTIFGVDHAF
jgi:hypothetical protein